MPILNKLDGSPFAAYFSNLAQKLGSEITDDTIDIPSSIGSGYIKNILLEENFCVRYFNLSFKNDTSFDLFTEFPEPELMYKLIFNLDNGDSIKDDSTDFNSNQLKVLLYSTDIIRKGLIRKNEDFRRIIIIFTTEWLIENYAEASIKMDSLVQDLSTKNKSTIITENFDTQNRFIATQLANELDRKIYAQIHLKTASFILLNDFLNKLVQRNRQDILSDQTLHYETMTKVEEKIMQSINQKLPNLDQLAIEFNLSLSTLKRHFRIVYGKNIYQYYQEKRMEWGKVQLEKGDTTISEIATQLGFYKINNFSIAFKKYFGVLPRELKHKNFIHINT
ncbi:MAG: AraC family transcriptional regulator [Ferruginibacter sp.]